jgi:type I restriction enzyme S subunit
LTSGNVGEGFYKEQGKGYISEETFQKLNCLAAFPGDLMISRLNEPVGRCCIIPNGEDYYVVAVDNVILRPNQNFCKKYLLYCMNTNGYANAALMAASGTTMQRISRTALGNLTIPVATYAEQVAIADYLDEKCSEIDAIISANNTSIEKLKEYRQSVIYEAVTGKVEI